MIKLKKLIALGLSSLAAMCLFSTTNTAYASYDCDVNNDGVTNVADAVNIRQYLLGYLNIANPDVADFNNDGFVSEADATGVQYLGIGVQKPINADYTPSQQTQLNNFKVTYNRYYALTGKFKDDYTVEAAPTIGSASGKILIGNDDRVEDYTHSAICKIKVIDPKTHKTYVGTGFVASDNSILTAAHLLMDENQNKMSILSITFYDDDGNNIFEPHVLDYSIPENYPGNLYEDPSLSKYYYTDYALIKVLDDLSDYNNLNFGYALQYAIDTKADATVTGYQPLIKGDNKEANFEMRTGKGRFSNLCTNTLLYYDCDTLTGSSGGPIYKDLIFEGKHYYTVVGINTSEYESGQCNCGVRMCSNITNLVRSNLN